MENVKEEIIKLLHEKSITLYSAGSCGELGNEQKALDSDDFKEISEVIYKKFILNLQNHYEKTIGLHALTVNPTDVFSEIFEKRIEDIDMDGNI